MKIVNLAPCLPYEVHTHTPLSSPKRADGTRNPNANLLDRIQHGVLPVKIKRAAPPAAEGDGGNGGGGNDERPGPRFRFARRNPSIHSDDSSSHLISAPSEAHSFHGEAASLSDSDGSDSYLSERRLSLPPFPSDLDNLSIHSIPMSTPSSPRSLAKDGGSVSSQSVTSDGGLQDASDDRKLPVPPTPNFDIPMPQQQSDQQQALGHQRQTGGQGQAAHQQRAPRGFDDLPVELMVQIGQHLAGDNDFRSLARLAQQNQHTASFAGQEAIAALGRALDTYGPPRNYYNLLDHVERLTPADIVNVLAQAWGRLPAPSVLQAQDAEDARRRHRDLVGTLSDSRRRDLLVGAARHPNTLVYHLVSPPSNANDLTTIQTLPPAGQADVIGAIVNRIETQREDYGGQRRDAMTRFLGYPFVAAIPRGQIAELDRARDNPPASDSELESDSD